MNVNGIGDTSFSSLKPLNNFQILESTNQLIDQVSSLKLPKSTENGLTTILKILDQPLNRASVSKIIQKFDEINVDFGGFLESSGAFDSDTGVISKKRKTLKEGITDKHLTLLNSSSGPLNISSEDSNLLIKLFKNYSLSSGDQENLLQLIKQLFNNMESLDDIMLILDLLCHFKGSIPTQMYSNLEELIGDYINRDLNSPQMLDYSGVMNVIGIVIYESMVFEGVPDNRNEEQSDEPVDKVNKSDEAKKDSNHNSLEQSNKKAFLIREIIDKNIEPVSFKQLNVEMLDNKQDAVQPNRFQEHIAAVKSMPIQFNKMEHQSSKEKEKRKKSNYKVDELETLSDKQDESKNRKNNFVLNKKRKNSDVINRLVNHYDGALKTCFLSAVESHIQPVLESKVDSFDFEGLESLT